MPFIKRNDHGNICALAKEQIDTTYEYILPSMPELQEYASQELATIKHASPLSALVDSDKAIARVTEDLIHLLIEKHVILFTELPQAVQQKLLDREKLRAEHVNTGFVPFMDENDSL